MNKQIDHLLKVHYCCAGDYQLVKKLSTLDPTFTSIETISPEKLVHNLRISSSKASQLIRLFQTVDSNKLKKYFKEKNIHYVTIFDKDYPNQLKSIYDPPWVLYFQGNPDIALLRENFLSVVGTRHPSEFVYGELKGILAPVVKQRVVIISGLALGVDRMAHEIAIAEQGETIAILGYGFDHMYPQSNRSLYEHIRDHHLLITEYPPFVRPQKWLFPQRNRVISGLSKATFVVEAKEKSGSLITCDLAIQQGRDVFALPGRISNIESMGTNRLIQEGAKMILRADDILEEYLSSVK